MENTYVGPFLVVKKLGTNRRHRVYHARQTEQNRDIALKFISFPPNVQWSEVLEKIQLESAELQKLRHPNLVKVYGAGVHEDQIFFATELVPGESLASLLARRGKITPDLVVEYGRQIAEALHYLHSRDLVHAKLTPEKILITPQQVVKIADVRVNRNKRRRWDTSRLRELDIAAYMAPEQFSEAATAKSDLYGLGVLIYEMLTGKLPYDLDNIGRMAKLKSSSSPPSVASEVMGCPIWLDKLVAQMLDPDARRRPHSAKAVALAFDEIKKLDSSKKSTAAQLLGSFNALNAGVDKSEARALLSKRKKKKAGTAPTWLQSVPFLALCLLVVMVLLTLLLWPENQVRRMERLAAMANSGSPEKWIDARDELKKIKASIFDPAFSSQVAELHNLVRRKILVQRAEAGKSPALQSENIKQVTRAIQLERDQKFIEALAMYQKLVGSITQSDEEYYIVEEIQPRIEKLRNQVTLPETAEELAELIEKLGSVATAEELEFSNEILGKIIIQFAGESEFAEIVKAAEQMLEDNRSKLTAPETPSPQTGQ